MRNTQINSCSCEAYKREIEQLEQQLAEANAYIERIRYAIKPTIDDRDGEDVLDRVKALLNYATA